MGAGLGRHGLLGVGGGNHAPAGIDGGSEIPLRPSAVETMPMPMLMVCRLSNTPKAHSPSSLQSLPSLSQNSGTLDAAAESRERTGVGMWWARLGAAIWAAAIFKSSGMSSSQAGLLNSSRSPCLSLSLISPSLLDSETLPGE